MEALKYPIGRLSLPEVIEPAHILQWIATIEAFPAKLRAEVTDLGPDQLKWNYRPEGWSIRQLVHHCADSHLNSQLRFKLALTEDRPTIKPYMEDKWAQLADIEAPIDWSLTFLESLHKKWVFLLKTLSPEALEKEYFHPERQKYHTLKWTIGMYAWHCDHHLAHVKLAKDSQGKYL